jgi:hypothetical protein
MNTVRAFCLTRSVPHALQRRVFAWVNADMEFAAKCEGVARLNILPAVSRGELLKLIHGRTVSKLELSAPSLSTLSIRLKPTVCMRSQVLVAEAEECSELYFLQRGSLRLSSTLTGTKGKGSADGGGAASRGGTSAGCRPSGMMKTMLGEGALASAQMSAAAAAQARVCSKDRVAGRAKVGGIAGRRETGEIARKSFRGSVGAGWGLSTFRVVEREGSLVGISSVEAAPRLVYGIEAMRLSHLLYIGRGELVDAMSQMISTDVDALRGAMEASHRMHLDSLKVGVEAAEEKYGGVSATLTRQRAMLGWRPAPGPPVAGAGLKLVRASLTPPASAACGGPAASEVREVRASGPASIQAAEQLKSTASTCLDSLKSMRSATGCLDELMRDAALWKQQRCGSVAPSAARPVNREEEVAKHTSTASRSTSQPRAATSSPRFVRGGDPRTVAEWVPLVAPQPLRPAPPLLRPAPPLKPLSPLPKIEAKRSLHCGGEISAAGVSVEPSGGQGRGISGSAPPPSPALGTPAQHGRLFEVQSFVQSSKGRTKRRTPGTGMGANGKPLITI